MRLNFFKLKVLIMLSVFNILRNIEFLVILKALFSKLKVYAQIYDYIRLT